MESSINAVVSLDRISALPDSIIDHIFSFLDMRDVIPTSILSKRWRYLWASTPYLNFKIFFFVQNDLEKSNFIDFVDRVFIFRDHFHIHKLSLSCDAELDAGHLYTWLIGALRRNVQELCIYFCVAQPLELTHHVFTSEVTVLKFASDNLHVNIQMPISMCYAEKIKSLQLKFVLLPNGNSDGELNLSCPVLEYLCIEECDFSHLKKFTISGANIKILKLRCLNWEMNASCAIEISSPTLRFLEFYASMFRDCSLLNLSVLDSADIHMMKDGDMEREAYDKCLIKILKGIYNVKALTLSTSVMEDMGSILTKNGEDRGSDLSTQCKFYCLKTVKVDCFRGLEDEFKFLEFLLDSARFLEEMFIITNGSDSKEVEEFSDKLLALPHVSSSLSLRFIDLASLYGL